MNGYDDGEITLYRKGFELHLYNKDYSNDQPNYYYSFSDKKYVDYFEMEFDKDVCSSCYVDNMSSDLLLVNGGKQTYDFAPEVIENIYSINNKPIIQTYNGSAKFYQMNFEETGLNIVKEICTLEDEESFFIGQNYFYYSKNNKIYKYDPANKTVNQIAQSDKSIDYIYFVNNERAYFLDNENNYLHSDSEGNAVKPYDGKGTLYYIDLSNNTTHKVDSCKISLIQKK